MCIIVIYECVIFVFCYVDLVILFGGLMMSVVVVVIDVVCGGCLVMGYGYVLIGCFVQGGLICECFVLCLFVVVDMFVDEVGMNFDLFCVWCVMMVGEKLGGYGECCVVVGMFDMVIWDVVVKIVDLLLYCFFVDCF